MTDDALDDVRAAWLVSHAKELEERRAAKQSARDAEKRAWIEAKTAPRRRAADAATDMTASLEALLTSPLAFGLVTASPLQRALCQAADGAAVDAEVLGLTDRFGAAQLPAREPPTIVAVVAGIRSGKSLVAGAAAFHSACVADLSPLVAHEVPRVAILAPTVDNADATFRLLAGAIASSAALSAIATQTNANTIEVSRPSDGRSVEVVVVAAHRGGVTLRSRWLAGFVFDEVALFGSDSTGAAVNAEELLRGAETRLLPRAQGWMVSSPFGPEGLLHRLWREHFGKFDSTVLVVHAPTRAMNPAFPEEKIDAIRARDPDAAAREYDAQWLDADTAFFVGAQIDAAECEPESPVSDAAYVAAWDAATRGNAWTLVVGRVDGERLVVADGWQWMGSKADPLDPEAVIAEVAGKLAPYRVTSVHCDQWATDALRPIARRAGVQLVEHVSTGGSMLRACRKLATALARGKASLVAEPSLLADLRAVRRRALANALRVELPTTADGRHCDFASSVALLADVLLGETDGAVTASAASAMLHVGGVSVLDGAMDEADGDGTEAA